MQRITTLIALVFFTITTALAHDQTGIVRGSIFDEATGAPLADVVVRIADLSTQTDENGAFVIEKIPIGKRVLTVEKLGFQIQKRPLSIEEHKSVFVRIFLKINVLQLSEILVTAGRERTMSAASSLTLTALDFQLRPVNSAQDMMRNVPGLVTAQHAGGGKAEQIFLRGFDADHGTDVASYVDGIPVNMPSHGHGQGYMDLHFLLPELVKNVEVFKGTYFADLGDFATAGAVKFHTLDRLERNEVKLEIGSVPTQRAFANSRAYLGYQFLNTNKV